LAAGFFAGGTVVLVVVTTGVGFATAAGAGVLTVVVAAVGTAVDRIAALLIPVLFTAEVGVTGTSLPLTILCCCAGVPAPGCVAA